MPGDSSGNPLLRALEKELVARARFVSQVSEILKITVHGFLEV